MKTQMLTVQYALTAAAYLAAVQDTAPAPRDRCVELLTRDLSPDARLALLLVKHVNGWSWGGPCSIYDHAHIPAPVELAAEPTADLVSEWLVEAAHAELLDRALREVRFFGEAEREAERRAAEKAQEEANKAERLERERLAAEKSRDENRAMVDWLFHHKDEHPSLLRTIHERHLDTELPTAVAAELRRTVVACISRKCLPLGHPVDDYYDDVVRELPDSDAYDLHDGLVEYFRSLGELELPFVVSVSAPMRIDVDPRHGHRTWRTGCLVTCGPVTVAILSEPFEPEEDDDD